MKKLVIFAALASLPVLSVAANLLTPAPMSSLEDKMFLIELEHAETLEEVDAVRREYGIGREKCQFCKTS